MQSKPEERNQIVKAKSETTRFCFFTNTAVASYWLICATFWYDFYWLLLSLCKKSVQ